MIMDTDVSVTADSVAVVVVTYNSADLLDDLIASLPGGLRGLPWKLIIVDNDSVDASVETARRLAPDATIVETGRNGGYAAGINAGVAAAGPHSAVLVLNPDVRLGVECVPALIAALHRPDTGIAVPLLTDAKTKVCELVCQRRSDSRPLWRSKSRPVVWGAADMARAPIGALAISRCRC